MRSAWDALVPAWVLYGLVATLLLSLNMPPYENADEVNHFLRADQISRLQLVGQRFDEDRNSGGPVAPSIEASALPFEPLKFHRERQVKRGMLESVARIGWQGAPGWEPFANTSIYPPFFYAPSVVAIWVGKLAGISVVRTLTLARLLTGLACCALIALALRVCVRYGAVGTGLLIFAIATLPMSLALQSACSQDGLMLAASALAAALFAQLRNRPRAGGIGWMSLCLAAVAMARPPYGALALVPLAAPVRGGLRWAGAALVVAACLGWAAVAGYSAQIDTTAAHGANVAAQLRTLLDPMHVIAVAAGTWNSWSVDYLSGFIGHLGWLDTELPWAYIKVACGVLVLATLAGLRSERPGAWSTLLVVLAVGLSALLVFVAAYLMWTQVGLDRVDDIAGRYFLPLALVLAGIAGGLESGRLERSILAMVLLFPALSIGVIVRAVVVRYYLGA